MNLLRCSRPLCSSQSTCGTNPVTCSKLQSMNGPTVRLKSPSALVIGFPIPKDPTVCKHSLRSYLFQTEVVLGELFQLCTIRCSTLELTSRERLSRNWLSYEQPKLFEMLLRKEVIQPHLPVRLPCYDLVPITDPTLSLIHI